MANQIAIWLNKGYAEKLVKAASNYWEESRNYVMWAVSQSEDFQNKEPILGLLAWERLTTRLPNESNALYSKRVQHALVNTIDAGEMASVKRIFERLGLEVLNVRERIDGRDWDVIAIDMSDTTLANANLLLPEIIQLYGRTCRRYELTVHNKAMAQLNMNNLLVQHDHTLIFSPTTFTAQNLIAPSVHFGFLNKISGTSIAKETS